MGSTADVVLMTAPGKPLERRSVPSPRPRAGGAILETVASEVCGTDVHLWHGRLAGVPYPIIPGHVSVGRLLESDGPVTDVEGNAIAPGTLVTFYDVFGACGECWQCAVARAPNRCPKRRVYGITAGASEGARGTARSPDRYVLLGGWAERIELLPGVRVVPLPSGIDEADFLGGGCGLPTGFHAVERAGVALGDTVVVQGSGPVGLNAAIFAQLAGALRVLVVGAPKARLDAARRLGAEDVLDISEAATPEERIRWVRERTSGRGADVVIEASGNPAAVPEGLEMLRDAGRYVIVGHYTDSGEASISPHHHINKKHATILGCWGYEFTHLYRSLAMLARHAARFRWRELVTREYSLAQAQEALEDMERLAVVKAVIRPGR